MSRLSDEEEMLGNSVAAFAEEVIAPRVSAMDRDSCMHKAVIDGLFSNGIMGVEMPMEWGGAEASFTAAIATVEQIARVDPAVAVLVDIQNTLINNMLRFWGSDELQNEWGPRLCTDTVGSFCLSEPHSGSDAFALKTRAELSGDSSYYTINGSKIWISNAEHAGVFFVMANVDPSKGYKGITCFVVDAATPGIDVGAPEDKLGIRASSTCPLSFTDVRVPAGNVLGEVGQGYRYAIQILNEGRIGIGGQMVGLAEGAYKSVMPYLFERAQFGTLIGDFQAMQHQYADIATDIETSRLLVYNAARLKETGEEFVKEAAMAKLHSARVAERTASQCLELMGGVGFVKEYKIEKFFRDSKVGSIYEGTSNIQLQTIAKMIRPTYA